MGNPTVTPLVEQRHDFGFIISTDSPRHRCIDSGTLASGLKYYAGTILGAAIAALVATSAVLGTNGGNGTMGTVSVVQAPATQVGAYTLTMTGATTYTIVAPDGQVSNGSTGVAFSALGIGLTLTAGGTAFVAGDGFALTVTRTPGVPTFSSAPNGGNTGNGTIGSTSVTGYAALPGLYTVNFDDATHFNVSSPAGQVIGHGVTGTVFKGGGLSFTITAGGTAFSPADAFTITVGAGTGYFTAWDPANTDGSEIVAGILCATKDATLAVKPCAVLARDSEVNQSELIFPTGANVAVIAQAVAGLKAIGILAR